LTTATTALSSPAKVTYNTVGDVLAKEKERTNPVTVKMKSSIKEVDEKFKSDEQLSNVLVVDENQNRREFFTRRISSIR
jgi:CBS domain-containing protein